MTFHARNGVRKIIKIGTLISFQSSSAHQLLNTEYVIQTQIHVEIP